MTVSNSKTPTGLDEAVRMFAGYVRGENGFDELDFKEWLIEWREQEIATLNEIIAENTDTINGTIDADGVFESLVDRIEALRTKGK